jgi:hypothetical protein
MTMLDPQQKDEMLAAGRTLIGFSTPSYFNPVSWLIRKITKSQVSHAWMLYRDDDFDLDMVMEAHELGFRLLPYDKFLKHNRVVELVAADCDLAPGLRMLAHSLGDSYDYGGLLGMSFVLIGRWFKRKWRNPFSSPRLRFCSEALVQALQASGSGKAEDLIPEGTSPQMLMEAMIGKV